MKSEKINSLVKGVTYLLLIFVCLSEPAIAQPVLPKKSSLLGGEFVSGLSRSAVAFIDSGSYTCSGVLVGKREILTAAHCVDPTVTVDKFRVYVGGRQFKLSAGYYHPYYDQLADLGLHGAQYDLGMLILSSDVTTVSPLPIVYDHKSTQGMKLHVYGYGASEVDPARLSSELDGGKTASVIINDFSDGMFISIHEESGASVCSGDSGGPALLGSNGIFGVMGIASLGTNGYYRGQCFLDYGGSAFVDLQSTTSRDFLMTFPGVRWASGQRIVFSSSLADIKARIVSARKINDFSAAKKSFSSIARKLDTLVKTSGGPSTQSLNRAVQLLRSAAKTRNKKKRASAAKSAATEVNAAIAINLS